MATEYRTSLWAAVVGGIFGLVGASAGIAGTLIVTDREIGAQNQQSQDEFFRTERRLAYANFLAADQGLFNAALGARDAFNAGSYAAARKQHPLVIAAREAMLVSYYQADIIASPAVRTRIQAVYDAQTTVFAVTQGYLSGPKNPTDAQNGARIGDLSNALGEAADLRSQLISEMREALNADLTG